jgi:hypothetical protein
MFETIACWPKRKGKRHQKYMQSTMNKSHHILILNKYMVYYCIKICLGEQITENNE